MEKENLAIRISGVKKEYRLGNIGGRTLQADLQSWFARKRGREDPNVKIGQDERLVGQKFMALNGIDLTIRQGEMCGIIGSNGAGKSTLMMLPMRSPSDLQPFIMWNTAVCLRGKNDRIYKRNCFRISKRCMLS